MNEQSITAVNVDLSNCDRELVQFTGAVQPHGCLIVLREPGLDVVGASKNVAELIGLDPDDLFFARLGVVVGVQAPRVLQALARADLDKGPVHICELTLGTAARRRRLNLFAHRCAGAIIAEFEVVPVADPPPISASFGDVKGIVAALQSATTLQDFFDQAMVQLKSITGFERVMAYRFLEDGSGHVIAEAKDPELEAYRDLHYPASDIPEPARRLFALSWLRHLPNVSYAPIPIVRPSEFDAAPPIDLGYSILRSVSPMYSGYLKNMGAKATMVLPLMKEGRLWGLVSAMNHSAPRHVPYERRMAVEIVAHSLSLMMSAKEDAETLAVRTRMKETLDAMVRPLKGRVDLHTALTGAGHNIATYVEADGAAVVTDDQITRLGRTPSDADLRRLAGLVGETGQVVFATDRIQSLARAADLPTSDAAGMLAVRLGKTRSEFVLWFRQEHARTVDWAGDPRKPVEIVAADGLIHLSPRASFARWRETVSGRSRPWSAVELKAAMEFRWAVVEMILARAEVTEALNRDLSLANAELDSFAYVASHDLKEPLRGINHVATFIKRGLGDRDEHLETIHRLTKRMDDLIESLLQFSRTGNVDLSIEDCDLDEVVDEVLAALKPRILESGIEIRRPGPLPSVRADRTRLREILTNLIANAIKYNDKGERWTEIGVRRGNPPVIYVGDNGIGVAERDRDRIFEIFRRLHGRDEFGGGTGAGLTIVKKAIERHGGRIWLESEVGLGSTFCFTLSDPRSAPAP